MAILTKREPRKINEERVGLRTSKLEAEQRGRERRRQVDPLPLRALRINVPATPETSDEVDAHNARATMLADEWDQRTAWPDIDPLACEACELTALRERRVSDELTMLQHAVAIAREAAPLFERLAKSWSALSEEINPTRETLVQETMDSMRVNGFQDVDERRLRGMAQSSSEVQEFDDCARRRGDHRQQCYNAIHPAQDAAAVIAQRLDELVERLLL